jgi:phosphomannomutase
LAIVSVSGIRGIFGQDLSVLELGNIGLKFANFLRGGSCVVGRDTRVTSNVVAQTVISGLLMGGCTVYDLGRISTPGVFRQVKEMRTMGGLSLTASHNPPEWNGVKFVIKGGRGIYDEELEQMMNCKPFAAPNYGNHYTIKPVYPERVVQSAGKGTCSGVRLAIDTGGGVGSIFIPSIFRELGCKVTVLNDSPSIFNRIIDPTIDELKELSETVTKNGCDAGLAFDCDADRLVIVDEKGRKLSPDSTLLTCMKYFLENSRNRKVAASVDTTLAIEEIVSEYNGLVVYAKVGESNVVRKMIENNCPVGGEGSSGGYIESNFVLCRDGVYASTLVAKMIKQSGSLSEVLKTFPQYCQIRTRIDCKRELAVKVLDYLLKGERNPEIVDGLKVHANAKSWVLIRASNTENIVRISAEAPNHEEALNLVEKYKRKIQDYILSIA